MNTTQSQTQDPIENALCDADELLKAAADMGDDAFRKLRERVRESVQAARAKIDDLGDEVTETAVNAAENLGRHVQERPVSMLAGFTIGALALGFATGYACAVRRA